MSVPEVYRKSPSGQSVVYDFFDIAEGTGVVEFMGFATENNSGLNYLLTTNNTLYSGNEGWTEGSSLDVDFDITFNLPQVIEGKSYVRIPFQLYAQSGTRTASVTATIIHVTAGGTETTIGATQTSPTQNSTTTQTIYSFVLEFDLAKTRFKAGETLRVTVTTTSAGGSGSTVSRLHHSPVGTQVAGATAGDLSARLSAYIPFSIDV